MALSRVWGVSIVSLLLFGTLSLGCEKLQLLQNLNTQTLGKLNSMGGPFPWLCVRERLSLKTQPLKLVHLAEGLMIHDMIHVVHQTLWKTSEIYSMDLGSTAWSLNEMDSFRLLLLRQLRVLEECVWKPAPGTRLKRNAAIDKYFRKLRNFLQLKKFADCAWEIIRAETRAHLQQILLITAKISKKRTLS